MEFDDLPKYQQDLIRSKLIQTEPIKVTNSTCTVFDSRFLQPKLAALPSAIRTVARKAFYQQNTFHFSSVYYLWGAFDGAYEIANLVRKIGIDDRLGSVAEDLAKCTHLKEVEIGVDEAQIVFTNALPKDGYQSQRLRPQDIPYGLNMVVLRDRGVQAIRQLRIPKVRFTPLNHVRSEDLNGSRNIGPIPGGVLETIIAREMMGPTKPVADAPPRPPKRKADQMVYVAAKSGRITARNPASMRRMVKRTKIQGNSLNTIPEPAITPTIEDPTPLQSTFRFLDLPPELRNKVYALVLSSPGPIVPSQRPPISSYVDGKPSEDPNLAPHSTLALLQANKQINDEAVGIYYRSNAFVFFYPIHSMQFLETIGLKRRSFITNITLWYKQAYKQGNMSFFDFAVLQLRNLAGLEKLEIILDEDTARHSFLGVEVPGEQHLKEISEAGVKVTFRCPEGDVILWRNHDDEGNRILSGLPYRHNAVADAKLMIRGAEEAESRVAKKSGQAEKPV